MEDQESYNYNGYNDPAIKPIIGFQSARNVSKPSLRMQAVKDKAFEFRRRMLEGPKVKFFKTFDLIRAPYPSKYGLRDAISSFHVTANPYVHVLNRLFIVQFQVGNTGTYKTLLVSPSDVEGNGETPYFKRVAESMGKALPYLRPIIAPIYNTVNECLEKINLDPSSVDYITYDHLHTQDLRKWLGDEKNPGLFPNAKLLVMREEWESLEFLLPIQKDWYCPNGTLGIPSDRVILLDNDVMLGDSVAILRTPGHTMGNHSIVFHTDDGLYVTSENGISADCYSPYYSRIPGLRDYASQTGSEVVLNGNTLESSNEQYISMIQEREVAGPCPSNLDFYNVIPSSELMPSWLFPMISPTHLFGTLEFGKQVVKEL